jgi:hypothetical protein
MLTASTPMRATIVKSLSIPNPRDRPPPIPPKADLAFVSSERIPTGVEHGTDTVH